MIKIESREDYHKAISDILALLEPMCAQETHSESDLKRLDEMTKAIEAYEKKYEQEKD